MSFKTAHPEFVTRALCQIIVCLPDDIIWVIFSDFGRRRCTTFPQADQHSLWRANWPSCVQSNKIWPFCVILYFLRQCKRIPVKCSCVENREQSIWDGCYDYCVQMTVCSIYCWCRESPQNTTLLPLNWLCAFFFFSISYLKLVWP